MIEKLLEQCSYLNEMKRILIPLIIALASNVTLAQVKTAKEYGLESFCIKDSTLGDINFYVTKNTIKESKPLLVILDGSGNLPIYYQLNKSDNTKEVFGSIPFRYNSLSKKYHVVLISKPGVPFSDSLEANSRNEFVQKYEPNETYLELLSLDWRVNSASKIINFLHTELEIKNGETIAIGYSEGGRTVPKLAVVNKKITKVISIAGGGLNQLYNFITEQRLKAEMGSITADEAQQNIDSLYLQFEDIYRHANSIDKFWLGHTYKRWASYCLESPIDNMLKLDIPILFIAAGVDQNSPIFGSDYVQLEFLKQEKDNLTYKVYPNCDHYFFDKSSNSRKLNEMIDFVFNWIEN